LLTIATPCILPLVPIYLSALIGADIRKVDSLQRGQLVVRASLFSLGFILVFSLLGLTASSVGAFFSAHKAAVQAVGALVILLFGLKFLGLVRIAWLDRVVQANDRKLQTRFGGVNAVIMGVVFAAGWSPCIGPVLGSVLSYTASTTSNPWLGALYLATYGLGFALPLLLVAVFAEAGMRFLKRIGPHLVRIERAIGFLLVVVAGSMIFDLAGARSSAPAPAGHAQEVLANEDQQRRPAMLVFTSSQCAVCRGMGPMLEEIKKLCHGKKVWIEEFDLAARANRQLVSRYRIVGTPTFVFLDDRGNEAARLVGEQTERTLKQALSALRGEPCPGLELVPPGSDGDLPDAPDDRPQTGQEAGGLSCQTQDSGSAGSAGPLKCM
jgi:cytochrome c-type biogenesis protein